jgi:hypothetical protein
LPILQREYAVEGDKLRLNLVQNNPSASACLLRTAATINHESKQPSFGDRHGAKTMALSKKYAGLPDLVSQVQETFSLC